MSFKKSLSAVLVTSFVLPATLPSISGAQVANTPAWTGSATDAIDLIVQATLATNPVEAQALLARAQQKAADEKLSADKLASIKSLIEDAEKKIHVSGAGNPLAGSAPVSFTVGGSPIARPTLPNTPTTTDAATQAIVQAMAKNPELYNSMREIQIGRLERDSQNLDVIVKAQTNQTIASSDKAEAATQAALSDAGGFIKALRATGVIHDWSAANKALRVKHESTSVDVLAEQIVEHSSEWSMFAGAVKKLVNSSGLSTKREFAGISIEALGTYAINADLILRLADLYELNLSESQQDVAILTVLPVAKFFMFARKERKAIAKSMAEKLGELFAEARSNPDPKTMAKFYISAMQSPMMMTLASTVGLGAGLNAVANYRKVGPAVPEAHAPALPAAPGAAPTAVGQKLENAILKVEGSAANAAKETQAVAGAVEKKVKSPLGLKAQAAFLVMSTMQSGVETYATGRIAMWLFAREKQKMRDMESSDFHSFLMSDKSKAFFKLMIATMNSGATNPQVVDLKSPKDAHAQFIMNVARSISICSPADSARFNQLRANMGPNQLKTAARNLVDRDYRLLRFECDTNLGFGRYNQIAKEFLTFNGIPEALVGNLRVANYQNRLQMAELLMQIQFLNAEPSDAQTDFFQKTALKILGLERMEDSKYLEHFYAFIRERGGMVVDVSSPTGYSIRGDQHSDPYTKSVNYTVSGGPDFPLAPAVPTTSLPSAGSPAPMVAK